jgi:hypothetical protein
VAHGTLKITVELPVEEGELIAKAIECAVAAGEVASGPEHGEPSWNAQQADALAAVAKAYLTGESAAPGSGAADPYLVVVHVDAKALHGGAGRSDLALETVKRLTCDGSLLTVVEDEDGTPLDVGRKKRVVSTALRRALWSRDRGCTFPGCRNRRYVHAHHIRHWANGGETTADNLSLLCTYHHRLLHEGSFAMRRDEAGKPYFERPDGRVIPRCGYRLDDVLDDGLKLDDGTEPSADAWLAAVVNGKSSSTEGWQASVAHSVNTSTEVRERAGVYRLRYAS